jgi:hypothetical protein
MPVIRNSEMYPVFRARYDTCVSDHVVEGCREVDRGQCERISYVVVGGR